MDKDIEINKEMKIDLRGDRCHENKTCQWRMCIPNNQRGRRKKTKYIVQEDSKGNAGYE